MSRVETETVLKYKAHMKQVGRTHSGNKTAPDVFNGQNNIVLACLDTFGLDRWYAVSTKEKGDTLQMACYNGAATEIKWYTVPITVVDAGGDSGIKVVSF